MRIDDLKQQIKKLEEDVMYWREAYKELALAIANRDSPKQETATADMKPWVDTTPPLPSAVYTAILETTEPGATRSYITTAVHNLVGTGMAESEIIAAIRAGEDVVV